jgi:hypothetical protein
MSTLKTAAALLLLQAIGLWGQVKLVGPASITATPNKSPAETILTLKNDSAQPIKLSLSAKAADESSIQVKLSDEKATGPGTDTYDLTIAANASANVRAVVTSETPQDVKIDLTDKTSSAKLGTFTFTRSAFAVQLDTPPADKPELALVHCRRTRMVLINNDDVAHTLKWELASPNYDLCSGGGIHLDPKGKAMLDCFPRWGFSLFGFSQNLLRKDVQRDGYQLLLYSEDAGVAPANAPSKIIPMKATLDYVDSGWRQFISGLVVIVVLIVGGVCSLLLNFSLPNRLKRLNANERIRALEKKTADLSTRIDSRLSVALRLQRSNLADQLKSRGTLSPDFAGLVSSVSDGLTKLENRVSLVQQIDVALERLENVLPQGVAPSLVEGVENALQRAMQLLGKSEPSDNDLQTAQTIITDAVSRIETLAQPSSDFAVKLASDIGAFLGSLTDITSTDTFKRFVGDAATGNKGLLPGPYKQLQAFGSATSVPPGSEARLDNALQKMELIADYVRRVENTTDETVRSRLKDPLEGELMDHLQSDSWQALKLARLLLREIADTVYPDDLRSALLNYEASIVMNPAVAYERAPLEFCVCFNDSRIDTSAARQEWSCHWDFGDDLKEKGWSVSHYFLLERVPRRKPAIKDAQSSESAREHPGQADDGGDNREHEAEVSVSFIAENGKPVADKDGHVIVLKQTVPVKPTHKDKLFGERTVTETIKLAAALLIAVFGLLSGAQTQLEKLDILPALVAVFLVGFGADTIKNILTK